MPRGTYGLDPESLAATGPRALAGTFGAALQGMEFGDNLASSALQRELLRRNEERLVRDRLTGATLDAGLPAPGAAVGPAATRSGSAGSAPPGASDGGTFSDWIRTGALAARDNEQITPIGNSASIWGDSSKATPLVDSAVGVLTREGAPSMGDYLANLRSFNDDAAAQGRPGMSAQEEDLIRRRVAEQSPEMQSFGAAQWLGGMGEQEQNIIQQYQQGVLTAEQAEAMLVDAERANAAPVGFGSARAVPMQNPLTAVGYPDEVVVPPLEAARAIRERASEFNLNPRQAEDLVQAYESFYAKAGTSFGRVLDQRRQDAEAQAQAAQAAAEAQAQAQYEQDVTGAYHLIRARKDLSKLPDAAILQVATLAVDKPKEAAELLGQLQSMYENAVTAGHSYQEVARKKAEDENLERRINQSKASEWSQAYDAYMVGKDASNPIDVEMARRAGNAAMYRSPDAATIRSIETKREPQAGGGGGGVPVTAADAIAMLQAYDAERGTPRSDEMYALLGARVTADPRAASQLLSLTMRGPSSGSELDKWLMDEILKNKGRADEDGGAEGAGSQAPAAPGGGGAVRFRL